MFGIREQIPTARIAARSIPPLERVAARAKRAVCIAGMAGVHLVRAAVIVLGFGSMMWFAAATQTGRSHDSSDRIQRILDDNMRRLSVEWRYDLHRLHLHELMRQVEDLPRSDGSASPKR